MGQAKNRKAEIIALKSLGSKPTKVVAFGAYYKDLDDDGVSVHLTTAHGVPQNFIDIMYKGVKSAVDAEGAELANSNYAYFNGAETREEAIKDIWTQLKACIHNFNIVVFKSPVRPQKHNYQAEVNEDFIRYAMPIMTNIWHLQNLGEIPNDNYNGMTFAYVR